MKVVDLDKLKEFFLSLPNYTLTVVDVLKLIENQIPTIDDELVRKQLVIETIENSFSTPDKQTKHVVDFLSNCVKYLPSVQSERMVVFKNG